MTQEQQQSERRQRGFHPVSIGHLVMGLALLGLAGVWALVESGATDNDDLRWLLPIPWVVAGVVGLVASAITGTRRHARRQTGWVGLTDPANPPEIQSSLTNPENEPEEIP